MTQETSQNDNEKCTERALKRANDISDELDDWCERALKLETDYFSDSNNDDSFNRKARYVVAEELLDNVASILTSGWRGEPNKEKFNTALKSFINDNWKRLHVSESKKLEHRNLYGREGLTYVEWEDMIKNDIETFHEIDIKSGADHYIYVLRVRRVIDEKIFYYVGSTESIEDRYEVHYSSNGDFVIPTVSFITGEDIRLGKNTNLSEVDLELIYVENMYRLDGETEEHWNARLKQEEWNKGFEIALKKETVNILGLT